MPSALILIADGTEEMEFTIVFDTLTRAGVKCTSAFVRVLHDPPDRVPIAICSRGLRIMPTTNLDKLENPHSFDLIVIPGGAEGADTISQDKLAQELVQHYYREKKIVAMICAGSLTALTAGLPRVKITSHPSVREYLEKDFDYQEDSVMVSGNLVTSRGPGTAFPFALQLVSMLCGTEKRRAVQGPMLFPQEVI